ncbi:DUF4097 family beta strand repeat-containing protein [Paraglaciecola sp.]|uniref:DUF4097 family beta strand repeat-containing protein n=1 Tax=Paraglaciecola sp. TaxID=1920173 RepID=UPI00273F29AA|nr:DUF4097 family beta strand repeat-containing protein [Paraglaciecola sp.]MDP5032090.1 DUF4097 family beta strand repeat-containing protein [Paraglaciecola sp.]
MKQILIAMALLIISSASFATEKVDKTLDVNINSYIRIEHVNGLAKISTWDKAEVQVTGTLGDKTDKFIFERDGNEVVIKVKTKKHSGWGNWGSDDGDDLTILVPANSKINYSAVNADVEVSGVRGGADIETVNGSLEVKQLGGRIRLDSVNGNITATELEGDVKIETVNGDIHSRSSKGRDDKYSSVNGDITVQTESEELQAETVNGDVELSLASVRQLNLETVNGSLEANMQLQKNGEVNASSVGGSIDLNFQQEVSARFDIQAHAGGNIDNRLSEHKVQKDKYGPSRWLTFSLNGGNAKVNVSTVSGRVKIGKN